MTSSTLTFEEVQSRKASLDAALITRMEALFTEYRNEVTAFFSNPSVSGQPRKRGRSNTNGASATNAAMEPVAIIPRRRGRPAKSAIAAGTRATTEAGTSPTQAKVTRTRRARTAKNTAGEKALSVANAVLQVMRKASPRGLSPVDVLKRVNELGLTPKPNHLGIAMNRHARAGRLIKTEDGFWQVPANSAAEATSH